MTNYYNDLEADVPVSSSASGGPITFDTHRTYRGAVEVNVYDVTRFDGRDWAQTQMLFQLVDDSGGVYASGTITKNWGQNPGWVRISGGLGQPFSLKWRIGINYQATDTADFLLGTSRIKFDVRDIY